MQFLSVTEKGVQKRVFFKISVHKRHDWLFPLIRGMFVFRSGLRFSFRALKVPEPRVRKRPLSPTNRAFSSLSVRALRVPETKI